MYIYTHAYARTHIHICMFFFGYIHICMFVYITYMHVCIYKGQFGVSQFYIWNCKKIGLKYEIKTCD